VQLPIMSSNKTRYKASGNYCESSVRVQSTEYRVQSTGYRLQSTGYRVQSTEYRVQDTDYRVQGTEYRVQSDGGPQCSALSVFAMRTRSTCSSATLNTVHCQM
jgi:hypothetical protein